MSNLNFDGVIDAAETANLRVALRLLLAPHSSPVFGTAKTVEHEVAALNALKHLGYLPAPLDEFDLVERLRITRAKARSLLYQSALRAEAPGDPVKSAVRQALSAGRFAGDGDFCLIEVPGPLTMDRFRKRVRDLGYLVDGSFSGAVARVRMDALAALIEKSIDPDHRASIEAALRSAGVPDPTLNGLLSGMLRKCGERIAGEAGGAIGRHLGNQVVEVLDGGIDAVKRFLEERQRVAAQAGG